jgi:tripartite-type tricarboxylate transporter receptor subunit TctC
VKSKAALVPAAGRNPRKSDFADLAFARGAQILGGIRMSLSRRGILHLVAGAATMPAVRAARAQAYPARPVHIIVGFAAGGPNDISARIIGQWLSQRLGQTFVIENRAGAGGNIATELVVRAPPDGYTLLLVPAPAAINATLYSNLSFNFIRDIVPIGSILSVPEVMVVNPSVPAKTIPEFIAHAKANPGKINMASAGNGTVPHVAGELFRAMAGLDLVRVTYRGGGPAVVDLIAGQVQVMFEPTLSTLGHIRDGKLRALGVSSVTRSPVLPDVPTVGEFVPGYQATAWFGLGAPRNTPNDVIAALNREINAGLADAKVKKRLVELGGIPMPMSPDEFAKFIADETEKWGKVIRAANIKLE